MLALTSKVCAASVEDNKLSIHYDVWNSLHALQLLTELTEQEQ